MTEDAKLTELKGLDAEEIEGFKNACIINLVLALGGKFTKDIVDFERAGMQHIWGYRLEIPNAPTGNIQIDARISGATIELTVVPSNTAINSAAH